jgi:hypothetical protein
MSDQAHARRPLWIVVALLLAGAAALWGSSRLNWSAGVTGAEKVPALLPLALIYLAGIAGALATSGWARRVVGWLAVDGAFDQGQATGAGLLARGLALLAGIVVVGAGVALVRAGHKMPRLGANYQAPAAAKAGQTGEKELWRALSEGKDPTV